MKTLFGEVEDPEPWGKFEGVFLSETGDWGTPKDLYDKLESEFHFDLDPCPFGGGAMRTG